MGYMSFQEYVEKSKEVKKPKVAVVADYEGATKDAPEIGDMPDNAGGVGQSGKPNPYKGGKNAPNPNKGEIGFADHGDKKLVIKHKGHQPSVELKDLGNYPKNTKEWLDQNANLDLASFTSKLRKERLAGFTENSRPFQVIKEAAIVCSTNVAYVKDAILEMKRTGIFNTFLEAMALQPEGVKVLAKILENDEKYARKLLGLAFNEMVAPPVGDEEGEEAGEDEESKAGDEEGHHDHEEGEEGPEGEEGSGGEEGEEESAESEEPEAPAPESGAAMAIKKAFAKYMSSL